MKEISYTAEYGPIENPKIETHPEGYFRVVLPSQDSSPEEILKEKQEWVHEQQNRLAEEIDSLDIDLDQMLERFVLWGEPLKLKEQRGQFNMNIEEDYIELVTPRGRDGLTYLKNQVKERLRERITRSANLISEEIGVDFNRVYIRNQKTKWASCSSKQNLSFNIRSAFLPPKHLNYLIAHEVAHLKHPHHRDSFWNELEEIVIDYQQSKEELDGFWILSNRNKIWQQITSQI
jgi:predicted metal-dependent hydrolase